MALIEILLKHIKNNSLLFTRLAQETGMPDEKLQQGLQEIVLSTLQNPQAHFKTFGLTPSDEEIQAAVNQVAKDFNIET